MNFVNMTRRANLLSLSSQPKMTEAILKGDIQHVKELIKSGAESVSETDNHKRSFLHLAAAIGATEVCRILLSAGARVDAKDKQQLTPIHRACRENHDDVVAVLLGANADSNARDTNWVTPLQVCAANNALECARLIITKVVNVDSSDRGGATALHHAAFNGSCDIITFLLKANASPNAFDKIERRPLHVAASQDNIDAIRLLVQNGATLNPRDKQLRTPLHYAALQGSVNAIQALIELGADPTVVDNEGNSPLHLACLSGQDDVIDELLIASDSVMNLPNKMGITPLHCAAASTSGTACLEAITAYQGPAITDDDLEADGSLKPASARRTGTPLLVDARDKAGRTPMHLAAKFGRLARVQELIRVGGDPNASDRSMQTPLHYAVRSGHTQVIECLLALPHVDANIMDAAGMTPLHHAAFYGLSSAVGFLLKSPKAATPMIHDITGRYPHFLAAYSGNVDSLRLLLPPDYEYHGILDNFERSPLHYAAAVGSNGNQCLEYLLELRRPVLGDENSVDPQSGRRIVKSEPMFNVNQSDIFGRTPFHYAAGADSDGRVVELLLQVCYQHVLSCLTFKMQF